MKRNIELLTRVRDYIAVNPQSLDMDIWATLKDVVEFKDGQAKVSCGTTACIAGWAVQLAGDKLLVEEPCYPFNEGTVFDIDQCVAKNGRVTHIDDRAQKLLGLTGIEADILFTCDNDEAIEYLDKLIAGEKLDYDYVDDCDDDY